MVTGHEGATLGALLNRSWDRATARDWADILGTLPLFARVSKRQLRKIAELAQLREYGPGDAVVSEGDAADGFYLILGGRAKVVGKPRARNLGMGDYFGEMALLDGGRRTATVQAAGELQTMRLPRQQFLRLVRSEPEIAVTLLTELASRVRRLEKSGVE